MQNFFIKSNKNPIDLILPSIYNSDQYRLMFNKIIFKPKYKENKININITYLDSAGDTNIVSYSTTINVQDYRYSGFKHKLSPNNKLYSGNLYELVFFSEYDENIELYDFDVKIPSTDIFIKWTFLHNNQIIKEVHTKHSRFKVIINPCMSECIKITLNNNENNTVEIIDENIKHSNIIYFDVTSLDSNVVSTDKFIQEYFNVTPNNSLSVFNINNELIDYEYIILFYKIF